MRLHRNELAHKDRRISVIKAVASSAGIASWAVWQQLALLWGAIIALSQVIDALKEVFPFSRNLKAASELTIVLERLFIESQFEWENVYAGKLSADEIAERVRRLRHLQLEAETKVFPSGFEHSERIFSLAKGEANAYFDEQYGVRSSDR